MFITLCTLEINHILKWMHVHLYFRKQFTTEVIFLILGSIISGILRTLAKILRKSYINA